MEFQKDELLCREILLFEPYNFKVRTRGKGNLWKAITDNLSSLDGFKVDTRAARKCYGVIKAHFEGKEKEEQSALEINPEVKPLDTALEELQEIECAKIFEVEDRKAKEDQELAQSVPRPEVVEHFVETRVRKLEKNRREYRAKYKKKIQKFM